jgi:hypothetical protein
MKTYLNWHTHWDRAWYLSTEAYQHRLLALLERVLDLLESSTLPKFSLDGQTVLLEDAFSLTPELQARLLPHLRSGRLHVGPWFTSPDTNLVGLESLLRNLQRGMTTARQLGCNQFTGYLPDTFGQPESIPMLLNKLGIDTAMMWRGRRLRSPEEDNPVFQWQSPSGESVLCYQLPEGYFHMPLQDAELPTPAAKLEALQTLETRLSQWKHPVYLPLGGDHLAPPNTDVLNYAHPHLAEMAVVHPHEYMSVLKESTHNQPIEFEMGALRALGQGCAPLLAGTLLSRPWLKYANAQAEWALTQVWEPLRAMHGEVLKRLNVKPETLRWKAEEAALEEAWRLLLLNHPHDDICGCSVDEVHLQNEARYTAVLEACHVWEGWHRHALQHLLGRPYSLSVEMPPTPMDAIHLDKPTAFVALGSLEPHKALLDEWKHDITQVPLSHRTEVRYRGWQAQSLTPESPDLQEEASTALQNTIQRLTLEWMRDEGDSYTPAPCPESLTHIHLADVPTEQPNAFTRLLRLRCEDDLLLLRLDYRGNGTVEVTMEHTLHTPNQQMNLVLSFEEGLPTDLEALQHTGFFRVNHTPAPHEADRFSGYPTSLEIGEWHPQGMAYQGVLRWPTGSVVFPGHYGVEFLKNALVLPLHRGFSHLSGGRLPSRTVPAGPPFETPGGQGLGRILTHRLRVLPHPVDARHVSFHQHQLLHRPSHPEQPRPALMDSPLDALRSQAQRSLSVTAHRWQSSVGAHEIRLLNTSQTPLTLELPERWAWRMVDFETGYAAQSKPVKFINILPQGWVCLQAMVK